MTTALALTGQGRVTVFSMFGPVFAYASRLEEGRQVAYVGPVTPGVHWRKLWLAADRCCRTTETEQAKAAWIISQANRSFICGSDVVVKLPDAKWEMQSGGWQVMLDATWCGQDTLVTGHFSVPTLTADQTGLKPTRYAHYLN